MYKILECNMEMLQKKMITFQRKCKKYNCFFSFEVIGEEFQELDGNIVKFFLVEVEGKLNIPGWEFVASIDKTEKGNILRGIKEIPSIYYDIEPQCEHCGINRFRKNTYLIYNKETKEYKQVGKSCLKEYTNGIDANVFAYFASIYDVLEQESKYRGERFSKYYSMHKVLLYAFELIKNFGYQNKESESSTKYHVFDYLSLEEGTCDFQKVAYLKREKEEIGFNPFNDENKEKVKEVLNWLYSLENDSNYVQNLKTICSLEYIEVKHVGILVSIFAYYDKMNNNKEEKKESNYVGNIGDKISFKVDSFVCVCTFGTMYGDMYLYKIVDENGNVFIWKTNNEINGDVSSIKGTIKNQEEYKGIKQNILTRCKINVSI